MGIRARSTTASLYYSGDPYYRYLRSGVCPKCGGNRDDGFLLCTRCRQRNWRAKRRMSLGRISGTERDRRERRKKEGRCPRCGAFAEGRFVECSACRERARATWRDRKGKEC